MPASSRKRNKGKERKAKQLARNEREEANTSRPDGWQFSRRSKVERLIGGGLENKYMD